MNRQKLLEKLALVMPAVSKGDIVEQFSCFNFQGQVVRVTNGRLFIKALLEENSGLDLSINGKILYQFLQAMNSDEVSITPADGSVTISSGGVKGKLLVKKIESAEKIFDIIIEPTDAEWTAVPSGLIAGLKLCKYTASNDQTTGVLTGVLVQGNMLMSCDRYRITCYTLDVDTGLNCVIPVSAIDELEKHETSVSAICVKNNLVFFKLYDGRVIMGAGLIGGEYPVETLLEAFVSVQTAGESITIPVEIGQALERQNLIQQDVLELDRETKVEFRADTIRLYSSNSKIGEVEEVLAFATPASYVGVTMSINPLFFGEVLRYGNSLSYNLQNAILIQGTGVAHLVKTKVR